MGMWAFAVYQTIVPDKVAHISDANAGSDLLNLQRSIHQKFTSLLETAQPKVLMERYGGALLEEVAKAGY